jgi:VWFA-related protein
MPHASSTLTSGITRVVVSAALVAGFAGASVASAQPQTRAVYVSVSDKDGNGVTDLQPEDLEIKVGGKKRDIVGARRAAVPMRIALIVSDAGTGGFQLALANFMQKLLGQAQFSLISVVVQPQVVVEYSSEAAALSAGLRKVGPRGSQRGAQLMEAIHDAAKDVHREGTRPVIVVARVGAEAVPTIQADEVRDRLRKSGALLYVVSTVGAQRPPVSQARAGISNEQAQLRADEDAEGALNLGQVLGDGSRESGGRHDQVISTTLVPVFEQLAGELLNQYEITYVKADNEKPNDKIAVSAKRKGLTVRAPSRIPG